MAAKLEKKIYLCLSIAMAVSFLTLRHGFNIFNPFNLEWLRGDAQFHHMAFAFFKQDSWHWPPGVFKNMSFPIGTSIGATDSIPIMAFIFKSLRSYLPLDFHYFGLWQVICLGLQGYWSFQLFYERLSSPIKSFLGSLFLTLTPVLLSWRFIHGGLCAHFLILWCMSFYFPLKEDPSFKFPLKSSLIIHFLASLIQPYFLPMTFGFHFIFLIMRKPILSTRKFLFYLILPLMTSILGLYLAGHFEVISPQDPWGFGYYNTDISSLINPMTSSLFIPELPLRDGQHEGFAYLGLGVITLIIFLMTQYCKRQAIKYIKEHKIVLLLLFAFLIYSFGSSYSIFGWKVLSISKVYWLIEPLKNIFRSSGRFIWPVYYAIIFSTVLVCLKRFNIKKWRTIFIIILFLQIIDLSPLFCRKEALIPYAMISRFKDPFKISPISINASNLKIISLFPRRYGGKACEKGEPLTEQQERDIFWFALENDLASTALMGAGRAPKKLINQRCQSEWESISTNGPQKDTLYVFSTLLPNSQTFRKTAKCQERSTLSWCTRSDAK
jgi:hypothetical protein